MYPSVCGQSPNDMSRPPEGPESTQKFLIEFNQVSVNDLSDSSKIFTHLEVYFRVTFAVHCSFLRSVTGVLSGSK